MTEREGERDKDEVRGEKWLGRSEYRCRVKRKTKKKEKKTHKGDNADCQNPSPGFSS